MGFWTREDDDRVARLEREEATDRHESGDRVADALQDENGAIIPNRGASIVVRGGGTGRFITF